MEQNVLEIVRPAKTTVTIYGQVYEVRRIRYPAMIRIVAMVADVAIKGGLIERIREKSRLTAPDVIEALATQVGVVESFCHIILEESIPDFPDRDELSVEEVIQLIQMLWEVNQIGKAFERFFAQMGTPPQMTPVP